MGNFISHLRSTVVSGIVFLIPVFVLIVIIQKLYKGLTGFGQQLASLLGIKSVAGIGAASIATTIILVLVFYICGLLVKFAMFTTMKNWIENSVLRYIPGYVNYKVKMEEKFIPRAETRTAALIRSGEVWRPGFLVNRQQGQCTVFVPNTPDTDTGEVWVVDENLVKDLGPADKAFVDGIRHSGNGLVIKH